MPGGREQARAYVRLGGAVGFAVAYVVVAVVARSGTSDESGLSAAWPAGGLAIVWLLVRGARVVSLDTVLLAAAAFAASWLTGAEPTLAGVVAGSNLIQSWVAVLLLRRWCCEVWGCGGEEPLDRPRKVARLGAALTVAMTVGAGLAWAGAVLVPGALDGNVDTTIDDIGAGLWLGRNLCSALIVVALALQVGQRLTGPRPAPSLVGDGGRLELAAAIAFTVGMYVLAFRFVDLPLAFPLLATTVWVGARFSTTLSAAHSFVVGVVTMLLTTRGFGPFADVSDAEIGFLVAQFYVATIAVTGLAIATGRDERAALAAELRRTREEAVYEQRMRDAVIGSMIEGVLVVDETGELLVHNAAAARTLGIDDGPLTTESRFALSSWWRDGVPMRDDERPTYRALRGEAVYDAEMVVEVEGVGERVLNVSAIPLPRDDLRHRTRAMVLIRDTTIEAAHREELAAFAGVVAHDLRNPLAAIDGWTEMIADELDSGGLDAELAREFVSRVRSASRRMRELIRDLLAHATSSARDLDVSRVDITATVEEIAAARHAQAFISVEAVPPVLADPVLVRQVLDNLIGNALKYVAPGEKPEIVVCGDRSDARLVSIRVVDNGIGIPDGDRERIFEEFHRAHYREYEGSGLGLSIVRRIVTRHDGTIVARPNPAGRGSVFEFTLPAYDDEPAKVSAV